MSTNHAPHVAASLCKSPWTPLRLGGIPLCLFAVAHVTSFAQVDTSLKHWPKYIEQFRAVTAFLHQPHCLKRLMATCVNGTPYEHHGARLFNAKKFSSRIVHKDMKTWRWGTIRQALADMLPVRSLLVVVWNAKKYSQGIEVHDVDANDGEHNSHRNLALGADVATLTSAITSPLFWEYSKMLLKLHTLAEVRAQQVCWL